MAKTKQKNKEDLKSWLISFEKHLGKACVVTLLIEEGKIDFVSCIDRNRFLGQDNEEDDSDSSVDLEEYKKNIKSFKLDVKSYIG